MIEKDEKIYESKITHIFDKYVILAVTISILLTYFIKQCKNTRDSSTRRVLVMRHVLVGYELHEDFSKHIGKLVCRHGAKPCNEETELLGTLKASMTTTQ